MNSSDRSDYQRKGGAEISNLTECTYKTPRGVEIICGEDKSSDSASMYMIAANKKSSSATTRRILSMDGGGLRGLYEIVTLAVLEDIMNSPNHNPNLNGASFSISDYFDVVGGTSTGSILAAGLLSRHNYSTMDLLQLYGRYGYKIFDEQRRSFRGLNGAIYDSQGVDELLVMHFGKDTLQDIKFDKRLYIIGFDSEDQEAMVCTSHEMTSPFDRRYENHKTPMVEAIGVSSAAPVYFPARNQIKGKKTTLMKDGGLVANNPAYTIFQSETKEIPANYEIYSLGTGLVPATEDSGDNGYLGAAKVIEEVFAAQVSAVERNCREAMEDVNSELRYYVRLQPKLEAGKGDMDNTSPEYVQYAINKSLEVT
jgi:predicted acylesterase/phospholipase RssA